MGTKVYNNLPKFLKEIDDLKPIPSSSNFKLGGRICIFLAFYL